MVLCRFRNEACKADDFEMLQDKLGFVSYRFNKKQSYFPGGLKVIINNLNITTFNNIQDGLRIIVHDHTIDPGYYGGALAEGTFVSPGFISDLVINRVVSKKLDEPYNKCLKEVSLIDSFDSDLYKYILTSTNFSYRQKDCFGYCLGTELFKYFNITNEIDNYINACYKLNSFESGLLDFFYNLTQGGLTSVCRTSCPLECDSIYYDVLFSFSKIVLNQDVIENNKYYFKKLNKNQVAEHLICFNVYFTDLKFTKIVQSPKFEFFDLVSNIGGILFTGYAFLSFAELIELFLEIYFIIYNKN